MCFLIPNQFDLGRLTKSRPSVVVPSRRACALSSTTRLAGTRLRQPLESWESLKKVCPSIVVPSRRACALSSTTRLAGTRLRQPLERLRGFCKACETR